MKIKANQVIKAVFLLSLVVWIGLWIAINVFDTGISPDNFTDTYGVTALLGAVLGLVMARKWGGFKSKFGGAISFFALGMGLQFMGQFIYTLYYLIGNVEAAFPSVGDIPYMLSNVFYIVAVWKLLSVLCYPRKFYKPWWVILVAVLGTGAVLYAMTVGFLNIAVTDERGVIYQVLNIAYPLVQSVYFFLGIVALLQSRLLVGAKMFLAVSLMSVALLAQFLADFTFLYKSYHETWQPAGSSDLLYLVAYALMGMSIIMIERVRSKSLAAAPQESSEVSQAGEAA